MHIFSLVKTYEFFLENSDDKRLIRIELFEAIDDGEVLRARVWIQNTYNIYPTFLNLGPQGEDLKLIHSSDQLNIDITLSVSDTPEWITGIRGMSTDSFLDLIQKRIVAFYDDASDT